MYSLTVVVPPPITVSVGQQKLNPQSKGSSATIAASYAEVMTIIIYNPSSTAKPIETSMP